MQGKMRNLSEVGVNDFNLSQTLAFSQTSLRFVGGGILVEFGLIEGMWI